VKVITSSRVKRQLKTIDRQAKKAIETAIEGLERNPRPQSCLKIENEVDTWRIRVGEYRIAYHIGNNIEIIRAAHRSKFYARKEL
jgi:mRNA interferase RelE/StbE